MAARQTRRSISVKGITYQRIKKHVGEKGSISGFVEELLAAQLGEPDDEDLRKFGEAMGARENKSETPEAKPPEAKPPEAKPPEAEDNDEFQAGYTPPIKLF